MELKKIIEQYESCTECFKIYNYPEDWLESIKAEKALVFDKYTTKTERLQEVDKIHKKYSDMFNESGLEVKIPYEDKMLTLAEARVLRDNLEVETIVENLNFVEDRKLLLSYYKYLEETSWYTERLNDPSSGKAVPQEVLDKRAEARTEISRLREIV